MADSALSEFQWELSRIHSYTLRGTRDEANVSPEKLMELVTRNEEGRCQLNTRALATLRINNLELKREVLTQVAEFGLNNELMQPEQMSEFKRFGLKARKAGWGSNAFVVEQPAYKMDTKSRYDGTASDGGVVSHQGDDPTDPQALFKQSRREPATNGDRLRPLSAGDRTDKSGFARRPRTEGVPCLMDKINPGLGWNR